MLKYYRVVNTDLYIKNELIKEGSLIHLNDKDANILRDYLKAQNDGESADSHLRKRSNNKNKNKIN